MKYIDLYYVHNPATQLQEVGQNEFYKRLTKAFELLEKNVAEGKIKRYGLATWTGFRQGFGAPDLLDLETVIKCAKEVAGDNHHFKAIQLPYNLAMLEAVAIQNQKVNDEEFPIIPTAVHHGISVLVSAPLMQSNVLKLPRELFLDMEGEGTPTQKALQFVTSSPGVVSAMVGMKSIDHVKENMEILKQDNWAVTDLQAVAEMLVSSNS